MSPLATAWNVTNTLILAVFMAVAVPAFLAFHWIVDTTIVKLGTLFAEKQVLFDRYRGVDALMREVSLAETLVRSPAVREWAADETAPDKKARGTRWCCSKASNSSRAGCEWGSTSR